MIASQMCVHISGIIISKDMDSKLALVTEQEGDGFYVAQFKTSELAIFSYYVQSNKESFIIDPVYDVTTYSEIINKRGSSLQFVALTHYHADYLSGHTEFKVPIVMGANSTRAVNSFKVKECADGEEVAIGKVSVKVIHTPGHTPESSCYLLKDASGKDAAIFTGDTVFLGEVGRPDLACGENITSQDLAGMLYDSIQKLKTLDGGIRLYPGHGSGSACGKAIGAGNFCTLGAQHGNNYGFTFANKADFVTALTANIPKPPKYFFYDAGLNQKGANSYENAYSHSHRTLTVEEFLKHSSTAKIVDTRVNIGQGIIKGSYWLPSAGPIANWISNFIAPEEQFLLICEQGKEKDIIDRFFRIGFFKIIGYNGFNVSQLKEEFIKPNVLKFGTVNEVQDRVHLDVRSLPEYQNLGVVEGAILIPLPELESRVAELKDKKNIVINCLTGGRAKVAFSVLARNGISSNIIVEDFNHFKNNGFNVIPYQQ